MEKVTKEVMGAVFFEQGRILVMRRAPFMSCAGSWEFPGGKNREGESEADTLRREYLEELSIPVDVGDFLLSFDFTNGDKLYHLRCYAVTHLSHGYSLSVHTEVRWVSPEELMLLEMAPSDGKIRDMVLSTLLKKEH